MDHQDIHVVFGKIAKGQLKQMQDYEVRLR